MADSSGPKVICKLRLEFNSHDEAEKIHRSVSLDNEDYLSSRVEGKVLVAEIRSGSLKSLLHTLDDFLACTSVAEKIVSKRAQSE